MTNYTLQNCYYYLRIRLNFKGELFGIFSFSFFFFLFFMSNQALLLQLKFPKSVLKNIEKSASCLLKRISGKRCVF